MSKGTVTIDHRCGDRIDISSARCRTAFLVSLPSRMVRDTPGRDSVIVPVKKPKEVVLGEDGRIGTRCLAGGKIFCLTWIHINNTREAP
jgi:hypothetical protein